MPVLRNHGVPLDDSWIHQVIGRNVARFGVPGCANYRFLPFIDPTVYLLLFNVCCLAVIAFVLFCAAVRDGLSPLGIAELAA